MSTGIYHVVQAMQNGQRSLDLLADNLANLGTHGYKRRVAAQSFQEVLTAQGRGRVQGLEASVDFSQGVLERTADPLHVGLFGSGFFAVDGPAGQIYTRKGAFLLSDSGDLVTPEGWPVALEQRAGAVDPEGVEVRIDGTGRLWQGDTLLGRLRIVDFEDPHALEALDAGYWRATPAAVEQPSSAEVLQGELERSNSNGIGEVIELMVNQRAFELASSTLQQLDQSYRRLHQQNR